jgi:hypothetical protein
MSGVHQRVALHQRYSRVEACPSSEPYAIKLQDIVIPAPAERNESREPCATVLGNRLDQATLQCAYGFDVAEKDIALICNFEA